MSSSTKPRGRHGHQLAAIKLVALSVTVQIGFRHSPGSHAPSDALLELGSLPSTGITRLPRYYEPVRHPRWPGLALAGLRLRVGPRTAWGFPCCCGSPCADMPPPLPRWDPWSVSRREG